MDFTGKSIEQIQKLKKLCDDLVNMKKELDKSEDQYQFDISKRNYAMEDELRGTCVFDFYCDHMLQHTEHILKKLNLDNSQAKEIVFKITGLRV